MNALECYQQIKRRLATGKPVVSATVVRTKGSTPREVGAKMLVTETGSWGTVGGGCGEADVLTVALDMLSEGASGTRLVHVDLTDRLTETADRICGGVMHVQVETWNGTGNDLDTLTTPGPLGIVRMIPLVESQEHTATILRQDTATPADLKAPCRAVLEKRRCITENTPEGPIFFEFVGDRQTVLICGAGHIAQPLCQLAKMLDYRVIVIDDRPEFASTERFSSADQVVALPFDQALPSLDIGLDTIAVLVTRGHRHDEFCLRQLLHTETGYIGMLGSKRRVRAVIDNLITEGFTREQLNRIWAPIGIDIGALTPAEIAVSIMAEIVASERGRSGGHMKLPPRSP